MAPFPPHSELVIAGDALEPKRQVIEVSGLEVGVASIGYFNPGDMKIKGPLGKKTSDNGQAMKKEVRAVAGRIEASPRGLHSDHGGVLGVETGDLGIGRFDSRS